MLRCYQATGARTGELAQCRVGDVLLKTKQVVLGKHKRSNTQRTPTPRRIALNDEALAIFRGRCASREETDFVFLNSHDEPWKRNTLAARFARVKKAARENKLGEVRPHITPYSFRHLWISEALMA